VNLRSRGASERELRPVIKYFAAWQIVPHAIMDTPLNAEVIIDISHES
jgi:hypothetical protein